MDGVPHDEVAGHRVEVEVDAVGALVDDGSPQADDVGLTAAVHDCLSFRLICSFRLFCTRWNLVFSAARCASA